MLQKLLNNKLKIALVSLLVIFLALIRAYENALFYDPFLDYFKADYQNLPLPEIENSSLFLGLLFRYFLNSILSLVIIYVIFKDVEAVKFASILYVLFFVILAAAFFLVLSFDEPSKMVLFYIRRFLIQPILLLLFLPAFYFQKQNN
jgi:exosortase F-associated protein